MRLIRLQANDSTGLTTLRSGRWVPFLLLLSVGVIRAEPPPEPSPSRQQARHVPPRS